MHVFPYFIPQTRLKFHIHQHLNLNYTSLWKQIFPEKNYLHFCQYFKISSQIANIAKINITAKTSLSTASKHLTDFFIDSNSIYLVHFVYGITLQAFNTFCINLYLLCRHVASFCFVLFFFKGWRLRRGIEMVSKKQRKPAIPKSNYM